MLAVFSSQHYNKDFSSPNMEKFPDSEEDHAHAALPYQDSGQKRPQFKGIRKRKWGSWGSEIRIPKTREKIWLGSYKTAEQAARAYDAAVYCLRGPNAKFNFPGSVPAIPSTFSLSRRQIQLAAARYAREELSSHSTSPSPYKNKNKAREVPDCPTQSSLVSETVIPNDTGQQISEECDMALWEYSLFESSGFANLDKLPSIEEALGLDANPTWQEEEQDAAWLWNLSSMNYLLRETGNISSF